jgi:hypothetical protein
MSWRRNERDEPHVKPEGTHTWFKSSNPGSFTLRVRSAMSYLTRSNSLTNQAGKLRDVNIQSFVVEADGKVAVLYELV